MKKRKSMTVIISLLLVIVLSCSDKDNSDPQTIVNEIENSEPNTLSDNERKNGWELLFDGQSTGGWRGYNMNRFPDSWTVEDGSFTMLTEGGGESQDIITDKTYDSFAFSAEVKLSEGANSGIIYHVKEDQKYKYPYETGPEFQIIDHENWETDLEDVQIMGATYAMYPPKTKPFKKAGEWNHLVLIVNGNEVLQMLNGEEVVRFEKYTDEWNANRNDGKWAQFPDWGKFDEGNIALQNHGTRVWFRNIKIKELD
jgi:hypothetical protein